MNSKTNNQNHLVRSNKDAKLSSTSFSTKASINSNNNNNNNNNNNKNPKKLFNENGSTSSTKTNVEKKSEHAASDSNASLAATMMEQEKFMHDMMNLSQFASAFPNNPFSYFGTPAPFPVPSLPSSLHSSTKKNRQRSPSPSNSNVHDRSISPASSITSNISQQPSSMDFNLLMNNLISLQMLGGAAGSSSFTPPLHSPMPLPGLAGMSNDFGKLPVELLTALSVASQNGVPGMGGTGLDPNLFSALSQLNNLSSNAKEAEKKDSNQKTKNGSLSTKQVSNHSSNENLQNKNSNQKQSASSRSNQLLPPKNSSNSLSHTQNTSKKVTNEVFEGLDLSVKKQFSKQKEVSNNDNEVTKSLKHNKQSSKSHK